MTQQLTQPARALGVSQPASPCYTSADALSALASLPAPDLCPTANDGVCDDGGPGSEYAACAASGVVPDRPMINASERGSGVGSIWPASPNSTDCSDCAGLRGAALCAPPAAPPVAVWTGAPQGRRLRRRLLKGGSAAFGGAFGSRGYAGYFATGQGAQPIATRSIGGGSASAASSPYAGSAAAMPVPVGARSPVAARSYLFLGFYHRPGVYGAPRRPYSYRYQTSAAGKGQRVVVVGCYHQSVCYPCAECYKPPPVAESGVPLLSSNGSYEVRRGLRLRVRHHSKPPDPKPTARGSSPPDPVCVHSTTCTTMCMCM